MQSILTLFLQNQRSYLEVSALLEIKESALIGFREFQSQPHRDF